MSEANGAAGDTGGRTIDYALQRADHVLLLCFLGPEHHCQIGRFLRQPIRFRGRISSECPLFFATFLTRVRHSNLPLSGGDATYRAALCALALDTRLALLNGDGFALQCLFHQTFGLLAHCLF